MDRRSRAQSLSEYAIIIGLVSLALVSMTVYMKRGLQGHLRDMANQISPRQYESNSTESHYNTTKTSQVVEVQDRTGFTRYSGDAPTGEAAQGTAVVTTVTGWERTQE
jgi:hypothetical protein